jgi:hypothetical protein
MAVQTLHKPFEATQLPDTRIPTLRNATVVLFRELQDCAVPGHVQMSGVWGGHSVNRFADN